MSLVDYAGSSGEEEEEDDDDHDQCHPHHRLHTPSQLTGEQPKSPPEPQPDDDTVIDDGAHALTSCERRCDTCGAIDPRYTCPACSLQSCSLACVTAHKSERACSGKRARSQFVPVSEFTDDTLTRDLFLLDEVRRTIDNAARQPIISESKRPKLAADADQPQSAMFQSKSVSSRFLALQKACTGTGIRLMLMPAGMARHSSNASMLNKSTNTIEWTMTLRLHGTDTELTVDRVESSVTWRKFLSALITATNDTASDSEKRRKFHVRHLDAAMKTAVAAFRATVADSIDDLSVLMLVPMQSSGQHYYYSLSLAQSISESLRHCTVIEFPSVIVARKEDAPHFPLQLTREERLERQVRARHAKLQQSASTSDEAECPAAATESWRGGQPPWNELQ